MIKFLKTICYFEIIITIFYAFTLLYDAAYIDVLFSLLGIIQPIIAIVLLNKFSEIETQCKKNKNELIEIKQIISELNTTTHKDS